MIETAGEEWHGLPDSIRNLKRSYWTGRRSSERPDDLGRDFFAPCLEWSIRYRRQSYQFSSAVFIDTWMEALKRLSAKDHLEKIELLVYPELSPDDKKALRAALDGRTVLTLRQKAVEKFVEDVWELDKNQGDVGLRRALFAWLVANNKLELRFSVPVDDATVATNSIFHSKIGIFDLPGDVQVAFTGSANETGFGMSQNSETVDVYGSWRGESDQQRISDKEEQFSEAWEGRSHGWETFPLSEMTLARIKEVAPRERPNLAGNVEPSVPTLADWRHQDEAVEKWLENGGTGVLNMATGTGKTRTAFKILDRVRQDGGVECIIVTTDGTDLLNQWFGELLGWNSEQGSPYDAVLRQYDSHHQLDQFAMDPRQKILLVSRQQLDSAFRRLSEQARGKLMVVHDEVHGLGSESNQRKLRGEHKSCRYRLGLSATTDRVYDEVGTQFIEDEIGNIVYNFETSDAIKRGILCEFDYVPLPYTLSEADKERRQKVFNLQTARRKNNEPPLTDREMAIALSKVFKLAELKLVEFRDYLQTHNDLLSSAILFVEEKEYGRKLLPILQCYTDRYREYYGEDDQEHLRAFARGEIDCLVTCHKISQGIDVPSLKTVILFSSAGARLETIQRIGRCLRTTSKDPEKRATVVDFVESGEHPYPADIARKDWLTELSQVKRSSHDAS